MGVHAAVVVVKRKHRLPHLRKVRGVSDGVVFVRTASHAQPVVRVEVALGDIGCYRVRIANVDAASAP